MHLIIALLPLIPLVALLNHLGGQSTVIPYPRFTCRMMGISAVFIANALICGFPLDKLAWFAPAVIVGIVIWAAFGWRNTFMSFPNPTDTRDYSEAPLLCKITDWIMNTAPASQLTAAQCRNWGTLYGTFRGGYMYPFFIAMAYFLTPWSLLIGLLCFTQGIVYRTSPIVAPAEWRFGVVIGVMLSAILALSNLMY